MERNLKGLCDSVHDLVIIGGGIYGASAAWSAAVRGLSVALLEKADFSGGVSSNSMKIIHGGLRYLQNLDVVRVRQSIRERKRLMWLAPHLVHPLACTMPVYGCGLKGREVMKTGLWTYDMIGRDRNRLPDRAKWIPAGRMLSVAETCSLIPGLEQKGLRGAAQWYDAVCENTERLVVSFLRSACSLGGSVANYVRSLGVRRTQDGLFGIKCKDQLNGDCFEIRARNVINSSGPWINDMLHSEEYLPIHEELTFAGGINVVTDHPFPLSSAVGLTDRSDTEPGVYFMVPWRGRFIIGTHWFPYQGNADEFVVGEGECEKLIQGFGRACPGLRLTLDDVVHVHKGLVPCRKETNTEKAGSRILNHYRLFDHDKAAKGRMVSVLGVKYTTAVDVAEKVLKYIFPSTKKIPLTSQPRLKGGQIDDLSAYRTKIVDRWKDEIGETECLRLLFNYGSEIEEILDLAKASVGREQGGDTAKPDVLEGETLFSIRREMAQKLSDVILRRTGCGTIGPPSGSVLNKVSRRMADELGWSEDRRRQEIEGLKESYPPFLRGRMVNE